MEQIDLNKYKSFVGAVTSTASNDIDEFVNRIKSLHGTLGVNVPQLMTAGTGLGSEGGEFQEIVKKIVFQGKPLDEHTVHHMKRELGDVIWYWTQACRALGFDPNDVIAENVNKLQSRYPGGEFDPYFSENRQIGDL